MSRYSITFDESSCVLSDIHLTRDDLFKIPPMPHHDQIKTFTILNSTIPVLTEDIVGTFANLEKFVAVSLGIEEIAEDTFVNCEHLKIIELSTNKITDLDMNTFNRNPNLEALYLFNNMLKNLPDELLLDLEKLEHLDLRSNDLTCLSDKLFRDLKSLKFLNVSRNDLMELNVEAILQKSKYWKEISLNDNNFSVNRMNEILQLLQNAKIACPTEVRISLKKRSYQPVVVNGFRCMPDEEYERLTSKRKIQMLEEGQEAMKKTIERMQKDITFLLKINEDKYEILEPQEDHPEWIKVSDLEKNLMKLSQKG